MNTILPGKSKKSSMQNFTRKHKRQDLRTTTTTAVTHVVIEMLQKPKQNGHLLYSTQSISPSKY